MPLATTREKIEDAISRAADVRGASTVDIATSAYRSWDKRVSIFLDRAFQKDGSWLDMTPKDEFGSGIGLEYPIGFDFAENVTLDGIHKDVDTKVSRLQELLTVIDEYELADDVANPTPAASTPAGGEVFVIHGRDEKTRVELELLILKSTGTSAIVLSDQPNRGATVIEKFESAFTPASFAIAIMSADDQGGLMGSDPLQPRARQNVLLELGYAMGKLGRSRTAVLYDPAVDLPSDLGGIAYYPIDAVGKWKTDLLGELQAAGFAVHTD